MARRTPQFILAVLISLHSIALFAQLNPGTETALPPNSVFHGSGIDKVNLQNNSLHIEIPILSLPQRAGKALVWKFVYDTPRWQAVFVPQTAPPYGYYVVQQGTGGWTLDSPLGWSVWTTQTTLTCPTNSQQYTRTTYTVHDPQGTQHLLGNRLEGPQACIGQIPSAPTLDGSGMVYNYQTHILMLKDGTQIYVGIPAGDGPITDANGNTIYSSSSGDTLGRAGVTTTTGTTGSGAPYTLYSFYDSNGIQQSYRVDYMQITLVPDLCSIVSSMYACYSSSVGEWMPSTLTLPNTTTYQFSYSNNTPGELQQMTLPTGATINYAYQDGYYAQTVRGNKGLYTNWSGGMAVTSRTVTVGGVVSQWMYSGKFGPFGLVGAGAVTDPAGNVETHTFQYLTFGNQSTSSQYETKVTYADPKGNVLRTIAKSYAGEDSSLYNIPVNLRVTNETTTLDNGQSKMTQTDYETFTYTGGDTATRLNPTEVREYDFGGALLRRTDYTYLHTSNQTYQNLNIVDRPTTIITYDGSGNKVAETINEYDNYSHTNQPMLASGAMQHASTFGTSYTTRGNLTAIERWQNTTSTFLTTTNQYDDAGNILSTVDPLTNKTTFDYTDSWSNTQCAPTGVGKAYLTKVTNALSQIAKKTYDSCTGAAASTTDVNSNQTTYVYDEMGRTTTVTDPVQSVNGVQMNGVTSYIYTDTPNTVNVEKKETINSSQSTDEFFYFDGLGREISHSRANGQGTPWDKADECYDLDGRKSFSSYPYQASSATPASSCPSEAGDSFTYDALSRILNVTHSDSTVQTTSYTGRATDIVDEGNGNTNASERVSQIDGLGRLVSVCEVTSSTQKGPGGTPAACGQDIAKTGFLTSYTYDILGNVLSVTQGSMGSRAFTYDSLSHIITSKNPETGTTCYGTWSGSTCVSGYDADGNLLSRTRPAPNQGVSTVYVTTSYTYDALNRLTSRSYSDGTTPKVLFGYDQSTVTIGSTQLPIANGIGRLSWSAPVDSNTYPLAMSGYSYDSMGRTLLDAQCVASHCPKVFQFSYGYDLLGDLLTSSNGNGINYTLSYSTAPRLITLATNWLNSTTSGNLLSSVLYNGFGDAVSSNLYNGIGESWGYDARGRVQSYSALAGTTTRYSFHSVSYSGNGSVLSAIDTVNGTWSYSYDDFNRVASSTCTATCPNNSSTEAYTYQYDRYGNRWNQNLTAGTGVQSLLTFNGPFNVPNNRIDGASYDAAGNMLNDGTHSYTYDAENRIIQVDAGSSGTYAYDAEGRRVSRITATNSYQYLFDLGGRAVTELVAGATNRTEAYAGGRHVATQNVGLGTTYFIHADWLGTERARTNLANGVIESCQSLPFGDGQVCVGSDVSPLHFTGKERDTESNLDDFDARYYSSQYGRFMTPDWDGKPAAVPYAKFGDPLTLNLYTYVENAPLNRVDADGHLTGNTALVQTNPAIVDDCYDDDRGAPCTGGATTVGTPAYDEAQAEQQYTSMVDQTNTYNAQQSAISTAAQYTTRTYDVNGDSASAAMASANASSASGCGKPAAGCTNAEFAYHYDEKQSVEGDGQQYSASFTATNVSVTVSISVSLPNWTGYKNASASEQKSWDGMISSLKGHEEGHVAIFRAGVGEIKDALRGVSAKGSGKSQRLALTSARANLKSSFSGKFNGALAAVQKRSDDYDLHP